jgi:hypothetical protein
MNEINTDALAEAHYAKYDPAFQEDGDDDKVETELQLIDRITTEFRRIINQLDDEELEIIRNDLDELQEYLEGLINEGE